MTQWGENVLDVKPYDRPRPYIPPSNEHPRPERLPRQYAVRRGHAIGVERLTTAQMRQQGHGIRIEHNYVEIGPCRLMGTGNKAHAAVA